MAIGARQLAIGLLLALATALALLATASAAPASAASACSAWGEKQPTEITRGQARKAVLCLVNRERTSRGLRAFDRNGKLQEAAQRHTEKMVGTGCFAHECPGEADLARRLELVDYLGGGLSRWAYGENVAWGSGGNGTPKAIVGAWMGSSGHRANILSPLFREVGVGVAEGTPSSKSADGGVYTLDFGLKVG